jgi:serine/threonine-protein kinase ATR
MKSNSTSISKLIPFAVEASWATNRWKTLEHYLRLYNSGDVSEVFNLGIGQALLCLKEHNFVSFQEQVRMLRDKVAGSMTYAATSSLKSCHDLLLRCHVLSDLEMIVQVDLQSERQPLLTTLSRRLEVLGPYAGDKQYLLGVRRAAMELMRYVFLGQYHRSVLLTVSGQNMATRISLRCGFPRLAWQGNPDRCISRLTRCCTHSN